MQTIDTFLENSKISRINLLESDCEGFDLDVLVGAQQAIASRRIDAVLSEVSPKQGAIHTDFLTIHQYLLERGFYYFAFHDYAGWGEFHNALWLKDRNQAAVSIY
jgi:hypothetical protein